MRPFELADADRVRYHAAAVVASNHLVALLGQVERLAATLRRAVRGVRAARARVGRRTRSRSDRPRRSTGPVARGDLATVEQHLRDLDPAERDAYRALAREAARLTGRRDTGLDRLLDDLGQALRRETSRIAARRLTDLAASSAYHSQRQTRQSGPSRPEPSEARTCSHLETIADLRAACDARACRAAAASGSCRRWASCTRATVR